MDNITKFVWKYLNADSSIRRGLSRGIVNKRALAAYIIKQTEIAAPINAVISAIRRYEDENPFKDSFKDALDVIANSTMSSKNGVVSLTLEKDAETEKMLPRLFSVIETGKNNQPGICSRHRSALRRRHCQYPGRLRLCRHL